MGSTRPASGSVSFDRAASYYDRTRALSPRAVEAVGALLSGELRDHQPCLEVGVGTGRMALPLHLAGVRMAGVDLSPAMVRSLVERSGGRSPFPLALADATALPFERASFGAAMACHVLHLIPLWREALSEMARVVRPGGRLLLDLGGAGTGWWRETETHFCHEAGIERRYPGANGPVEVDRFMAALGTPARRLPEVLDVELTTLGHRIGWLEEGLFSFTWEVAERTRRRAAEATRAWARNRFGSLEEPRRREWAVVWRVYELL